MRIQVFVQNEAGSNQKNYHDEKTLEYRFTKTVSRAYPYPYGFVVGTTGNDRYNVDCFVITEQPLKTGQIVECEPVGLMEQIEDGAEDHNVLARLAGEAAPLSDDVRLTLTEFVMQVFRHVEGKQMCVGRFLGAVEAEAYITAHQDAR